MPGVFASSPVLQDQLSSEHMDIGDFHNLAPPAISNNLASKTSRSSGKSFASAALGLAGFARMVSKLTGSKVSSKAAKNSSAKETTGSTFLPECVSSFLYPSTELASESDDSEDDDFESADVGSVGTSNRETFLPSTMSPESGPRLAAESDDSSPDSMSRTPSWSVTLQQGGETTYTAQNGTLLQLPTDNMAENAERTSFTASMLPEPEAAGEDLRGYRRVGYTTSLEDYFPKNISSEGKARRVPISAGGGSMGSRVGGIDLAAAAYTLKDEFAD